MLTSDDLTTTGSIDDELAAIPLATADGPGAGQFLAAALREALDSGARLLRVQPSPQPPFLASHGVDFVFCCDDRDTDEVIRAGLTSDGQVVTTHLLRCAKAESPVATDTAALAEALRAGREIAEIRWDLHKRQHSALEILIRTDNPVRLAIPSP